MEVTPGGGDRERDPAGRPPESLGRRVLLAPLRALVAVLVVLDDVVRPLWQPIVRRFSALQLVRRAEAAVARLPPYGVLTLLAVPYFGVEPLKIFALWWMASGRFYPGLILLTVAHGVSFLVVERIYSAGRHQLMRIGWFAVAIGFVDGVRRRVLEAIRSTAVYAAAHRFAQDVRALARDTRERIAAFIRRHR
ncbi:hypothetical protein [Alsobacter sp. R-9]